MSFAIVRFTAEDDAPGIVASNWINEEQNSCCYPNVGTEDKKNKLLLARETPGKNWLQCHIKIIKEFSSYKAARNRLTEAEQTSNIESDDDITKPHRRKKRAIKLPGETSSSEDEVIIHKKKHCPGSQSCIQKPNAFAVPPPPVPPSMDDSSGEESVSLIQQSDLSNQGTVNEIQRMKGNQATMWSAITELTNIAQRNSLKLDKIFNRLDKLSSSNKESESSMTDMELLSLLPVGTEDFENKKVIASTSLRKNLVHILITAGGRDPKGMAGSMLRKLLTDYVAEQYSLTGRTLKDGPQKDSFEKTTNYKLIIHACSQVHPESNENVMREAVSDWLMQAKFRKSRREKKKKPEVDTLDLTFSSC